MSDITPLQNTDTLDLKTFVQHPDVARNASNLNQLPPDYMLIIALATVAASAKYLYAFVEFTEKKFKWIELLAEILMSITSSFIAAHGAAYFGVSNHNAQVAIIGVSGFMGVKFLKFLGELVERYGRNKIPGEKGAQQAIQAPLQPSITQAPTTPAPMPAKPLVAEPTKPACADLNEDIFRRPPNRP